RVPWIFSALLVGAMMAIYNPFKAIVVSPTFDFLAQLGMYFLLFIIGFEIDLRKLKKCKKFIFKATFFIIFLEAILGTLLVHFLFDISWFISFLVALSFATVGEAILIPILDEFKIINTKLGQSIIGIGTLDNIIEILLLIVIGVLIGTQTNSTINIVVTLISLAVLFILTLGLRKLKPQGDKFKFTKIEVLFLLIIFVLFIFIGIGKLAHAAPIAALLAGIGLNTFIPDSRINKNKSSIKTLSYGFFAPIFFLWIGASIDFNYLISFPLIILAVVLVSKSAKLIGSYIVGKKELGTKQSILLGIGLSVRFSTSIIIIKILFDNGLIGSDLYSVIVASSIIFKFIVPILFSNLLVRWKMIKK
ncbi:MAG: cation:proton antiporter, partial [Candidatus Nanoarchaeia archaeon]